MTSLVSTPPGSTGSSAIEEPATLYQQEIQDLLSGDAVSALNAVLSKPKAWYAPCCNSPGNPRRRRNGQSADTLQGGHTGLGRESKIIGAALRVLAPDGSKLLEAMEPYLERPAIQDALCHFVTSPVNRDLRDSFLKFANDNLSSERWAAKVLKALGTSQTRHRVCTRKTQPLQSTIPPVPPLDALVSSNWPRSSGSPRSLSQPSSPRNRNAANSVSRSQPCSPRKSRRSQKPSSVVRRESEEIPRRRRPSRRRATSMALPVQGGDPYVPPLDLEAVKKGVKRGRSSSFISPRNKAKTLLRSSSHRWRSFTDGSVTKALPRRKSLSNLKQWFSNEGPADTIVQPLDLQTLSFDGLRKIEGRNVKKVAKPLAITLHNYLVEPWFDITTIDVVNYHPGQSDDGKVKRCIERANAVTYFLALQILMGKNEAERKRLGIIYLEALKILRKHHQYQAAKFLYDSMTEYRLTRILQVEGLNEMDQLFGDSTKLRMETNKQMDATPHLARFWQEWVYAGQIIGKGADWKKYARRGEQLLWLIERISKLKTLPGESMGLRKEFEDRGSKDEIIIQINKRSYAIKPVDGREVVSTSLTDKAPSNKGF